MAPILPASISIPAITSPAIAGAPSASGGGAFQSAFADAIDRVDGFQQNAQASVERFVSGEGEELHHVAIATQKAELTFEMFMQVRNKIVAAYNQVMQMQV
ncbi:MAG: flagellar hook-basal body complex protein FliE [Bryobacteraceae bacterium]